jgi:ethanolamine utilization protein EutA
MHDIEFEHEHAQLSEADKLEMAKFIWSQESVELKTIGIDIGSSTSHLLFAKVTLQRQSQGLSSRFVVTNREVVWRSPIMLTPFVSDGTIDAHALDHFIHDSYQQAGMKRSDVDSGAVILTGEAIKRKNARAIDELFAHEAGKFVCATAGHKLECTLAAHGSGAVALSRERQCTVLHVDIGGGTTKLAQIEKGVIKSVSAFAVGGRLLAADSKGEWTRVDQSAWLVAKELGIATDAASLSDPAKRQRIARRLAELCVDQIVGAKLDELGHQLELTEPLARTSPPDAITFSGGVSEYIFETETREFGDIAKTLAMETRRLLQERSKVKVVDPGNRIRATVIGASQFTVQVSGKTIFLSGEDVLPVHNVPVVHLDLDLSGEINPDTVAKLITQKTEQLDIPAGGRMAISFTFAGDPEYKRLYAMAQGILKGSAPKGKRNDLLLLMIDGDVGKSMGNLLMKELDFPGDLVSIDGVQLQELDYVDVGELISPPGVVPVVIKSLLFS